MSYNPPLCILSTYNHLLTPCHLPVSMWIDLTACITGRTLFIPKVAFRVSTGLLSIVSSWDKSVEIQGANSPWTLIVLRNRQIFAGPQYGTCFTSVLVSRVLRWPLQVLENLCIPDLRVLSAFVGKSRYVVSVSSNRHGFIFPNSYLQDINSVPIRVQDLKCAPLSFC
jgi:hypothetical protein